jgi:hypothetical protein
MINPLKWTPLVATVAGVCSASLLATCSNTDGSRCLFGRSLALSLSAGWFIVFGLLHSEFVIDADASV